AVEVGLHISRRFPKDDGNTSRIASSHCYAKRYSQAAALCQKRLEDEPRCYATMACYCCLLSTCPDDKVRDPKKAARLAAVLERDCRTTQPDAAWVVACASAANGDYARACKLLHQVLRHRDTKPERALMAKRALAKFARKKPYLMEIRASDLRWIA